MPEYASICKNAFSGINLFTYCFNNPINDIDPTGEITLIACVVIGAVIGLVIGSGAGAYISYKKYNKVKWKYVIIGGCFGVAIGALAGYSIGVAINAVRITSAGLATQAANLAKNTSKLKYSASIQKYVGVRKYYNYSSLIKKIIQSAIPLKESSSTLKWVIPGSMNGKSGMWELVINPVSKTIYHFLFKS